MSRRKVRRNQKDTMFRMLFSNKKELLGLYNAANGTEYDNVEDLEINTLENAIYMNMKNDVSFVFDFELNLYEHQSSINPNMPLRDLFYVSKILQNFIKNEDLYSSKLIKIPTPRFVVFYNGQREVREKSVLRLSAMYEKTIEEPEMELAVTVLNINPGKNEEIVKSCKTLKEYMLYTQKVREKLRFMNVEEAVNEAVEECIQEGILEEFLTKNRTEAIAVSIYEYDEEKHLKNVRDEGYEDGRNDGHQEKGIQVFLKLLDHGFSEEEARQLADISEELAARALKTGTDTKDR